MPNGCGAFSGLSALLPICARLPRCWSASSWKPTHFTPSHQCSFNLLFANHPSKGCLHQFSNLCCPSFFQKRPFLKEWKEVAPLLNSSQTCKICLCLFFSCPQRENNRHIIIMLYNRGSSLLLKWQTDCNKTPTREFSSNNDDKLSNFFVHKMLGKCPQHRSVLQLTNL